MVWPGSTSLRPMNQESMPGPVAMASQTWSGVASTCSSSTVSNSCPIVRLLARAGVDGDDETVRAAARRVLVVVAADERGALGGQVLGEGGPLLCAGEPDLPRHGEGGDTLLR